MLSTLTTLGLSLALDKKNSGAVQMKQYFLVVEKMLHIPKGLCYIFLLILFMRILSFRIKLYLEFITQNNYAMGKGYLICIGILKIF
jgi:hypothetical protein